jgi:hypothetical protein
MRSRNLDRALESLGRRQHGVFRRGQALALGFTPHMVERRLASGDWIRLAPAVYALSAAPATWRRQAKAAELSVVGSAVSHRAAAVLHEVPGFRPGAIDLTALRPADSRSPLARVHRRTTVATRLVDGIVTTTLARTVVDLAAQVPASTVASVFDDLVLRRRLRVDDLRREYELLAPTCCRGIGVVRRLLLDRVDGEVPAANELERALRRLLDDPRIPRQPASGGLPLVAAGAAARRCPRPGLASDHRGRRSSVAPAPGRLRTRPLARPSGAAPRVRGDALHLSAARRRAGVRRRRPRRHREADLGVSRWCSCSPERWAAAPTRREPAGRSRPDAGGAQAGRLASMASMTSAASGATIGRNRATTSPLGATRNFSKFHWMSPALPSASGLAVSSS